MSDSFPRALDRDPARPGRVRHFLEDMRMMGTLGNMACSIANRVYLRDRRGRWPGSRRVVGMTTPGLEKPVLIRLGATDLWVYQEIFCYGEYMAALDPALGPVRTIVDLGANVGISLRFWRAHFPQAAILAVEPDPGNFALLARNAALAARPEATLVRACVSDRRGQARLDATAGDWGVRMAADGAHETGAPTTQALTMPDVLAAGGEAFARDVDLLKCDIEGAERRVFADCRSWVNRVRAMIVETHGSYGPEGLASDLDRAGYLHTMALLKRINDVHLLLVRRTDQ